MKRAESRARQEEIIRLLRTGKKSAELAKQFGVSKGLIRFCRIKAGIKHPYHVEGCYADICRRYLAGESTYAIAESYGGSAGGVQRILKVHGIPRRDSSAFGAGRHYPIDETVFDAITPESAYWVGFLMADGYVGKGRVVEITVAEEDIAHLRKFRRFLKTTMPIAARGRRTVLGYTSQPLYRFTITSKPIGDALARFGVVGKKWPTTDAGQLADNRDFWRGVVDGDGCLVFSDNGTRVDYPAIRCLGSERLMNQFADFIERTTGHRPRVCQVRKIFETRANGSQASKLARVLYHRCHVALLRKLKKAKIMMKMLI